MQKKILTNKIKSVIQIIFYVLNQGKQKNPFHIMNANAIYEKCKSGELITSFNLVGVSVSYKGIRQHRSNLAKLAILKSNESSIPMPNNFVRSEFTLAAVDHFDHSDENSLSGMQSTHHTAMILCQTTPDRIPNKPCKDDVNLKSVKSVKELPCQRILNFTSNKKISLPGNFSVYAELFKNSSKVNERENVEFIIIFLPMIPHPVTEHFTVYTAMNNFLKVLPQLDQRSMPVFCDGVYRLVVEIYLKCPEKFKPLVPCLGGFHMAKCLQHCIGKYIKGTGLDDVLLETNIFGKKTIEQILNGTHYVRSLRGFIIIGEAIERLKWKAFFEQYGKDKNYDFSEIQRLMLEINNKSNENCVSIVDNCIKNIKSMKDDFDQFASFCSRNSEVCKYWEGFLNLCSLMKSLIVCDRTGNWQGHLQTVQELLPVFLECDSINYLRYASFYLETMRKLPQDNPEIYKEFIKGKFAVKTEKGSFNAVSPDMKLEQTIQRSKKINLE